MKSITLIGMPGAGKSTIGVILAKSLLCDFRVTSVIRTTFFWGGFSPTLR